MILVMHRRTRTGTRRPIQFLEHPRAWLEFLPYESSTRGMYA